ncbi:MAG: O-succinylhomoserine sulfhydrylase [Cardiobacteriaceae bacterium]|nr:O-succinylhomoserine sulfhydrylase [Cardiobacteriaceae bacterium]
MTDFSKKHFATRTIRELEQRSAYREHSPALHLTSSFVFESAAQAADIFAEREAAFSYSRFGNPTTDAFEKRLCALEEGARCTATASGMSAILSLALAQTQAGDHIICARNSFGSTINLFTQTLAKFSIETTLVNIAQLDEWRAAMRPNTKLLFAETPANPLLDLADIAALADIAHQGGAKLVIDNCFATPYLQLPLTLGADFSLHSATKYLDGQGRIIGGAVVSRHAEDGDALYRLMRGIGTTMNAFEAWICLKSLETLHIRMQRHSENALHIARWLESRPEISRVYYPGLASHPQHALAQQQMHGGYGGIVSFDLKGGKDAAWHLIDHCDWLSVSGNLGDARTIITHPDSTTHGRVAPEEKARIGLTDGAIRLSVGLEDADDICAALAQSLKN